MYQGEDMVAEDKPVDVLVVEDDVQTALALAKVITRDGYLCETVSTLADAMNRVASVAPGIVLLDLSLPDGDGTEFIAEFKKSGVNEVIVISGTDDAERTRRCLQAGVFDFILKPAGAEDVLRSVRRADGHRRQSMVAAQEYPVRLKPGFGSLEGSSVASQRLLGVIKQVSREPFNHALIVGQPGVLKADVAALVHHYSGRHGQALVVNCASENDDQDQKRFFGECEGVDNDSADTVTGYLQKACNGTLVLDDVSSLSINVQRRLAAFMDSGDVLPECSLKPIKIKCALIGLLREPAEAALASGQLHEPLYYALARSTIAIPPLVERRDDIAFFARHAVTQLNRVFLTEKSLSAELIEQLESYYWPGNLVELKNCLLTAYRYTEAGDEIKPNTLLFTDDEDPVNDAISPFVGQSFREVERQLITATLAANNNNKSQSAKVLGISLKTLYNRLNSYEEQADSAVC